MRYPMIEYDRLPRHYNEGGAATAQCKGQMRSASPNSGAKNHAQGAHTTAGSDAAAAASAPLPASEPAAAFVLPDKPEPSVSGLSMEYTPGTDPPLEAVGLGSWMPSGRVQVLLDYLHNSVDIPWCGSIVIGKPLLV